jgi:hypothetical protein
MTGTICASVNLIAQTLACGGINLLSSRPSHQGLLMMEYRDDCTSRARGITILSFPQIIWQFILDLLASRLSDAILLISSTILIPTDQHWTPSIAVASAIHACKNKGL